MLNVPIDAAARATYGKKRGQSGESWNVAIKQTENAAHTAGFDNEQQNRREKHTVLLKNVLRSVSRKTSVKAAVHSFRQSQI